MLGTKVEKNLIKQATICTKFRKNTILASLTINKLTLTKMTKEEIFQMINAHPVMYVATNDNGQPRVRGILMHSSIF